MWRLYRWFLHELRRRGQGLRGYYMCLRTQLSLNGMVALLQAPPDKTIQGTLHNQERKGWFHKVLEKTFTGAVLLLAQLRRLPQLFCGVWQSVNIFSNFTDLVPDLKASLSTLQLTPCIRLRLLIFFSLSFSARSWNDSTAIRQGCATVSTARLMSRMNFQIVSAWVLDSSTSELKAARTAVFMQPSWRAHADKCAPLVNVTAGSAGAFVDRLWLFLHLCDAHQFERLHWRTNLLWRRLL